MIILSHLLLIIVLLMATMQKDSRTRNNKFTLYFYLQNKMVQPNFISFIVNGFFEFQEVTRNPGKVR